jgi:hypothetical protein
MMPFEQARIALACAVFGRLVTAGFKSAINGAIRRGLLEYDGQLIRQAK